MGYDILGVVFKRFSICYLGVLLSATFLRAGTTGILEGTITDKANGKPLMGAQIIIRETRQGAATDPEGFYKIHNIRAGSYSVMISMIGYQTQNYQSIIIRPDRKTRLSASLVESPIEMAAIEVKATRPLIETDVTGTSYDISARRIADLPIDQFQQAVGMQAGTTTEGNVRGGKTREVLYLIDGLPIQDVIRGGLGTYIPNSAVLQMSVKTGGFNAEYGNALSGIVNVITKTGSNDHYFLLRSDKDNLFGGTQVSKTNDLEFAASGPLISDRLFYFSATQYIRSDTRWWQDMQYFFASPIRREWNGLTKLDWLPSPSKRLSAQLIFSANRWRDYEFSWRYNLDGLPPQRRNSWRSALFWTHTLSKNTYYSFSLSQYALHSRIGESELKQSELIPYQYDFFLLYIISGRRLLWATQKQYTYSLKGDFTSQIHPYHLLKAGFQIDQYDIDANIQKMEPQLSYFGRPLVYEPLLNFSTQYHYYPRSGSIYFQDKIEAGRDRSVITVGLRYDFLDPRASRPAVELIPKEKGEFEEQVTGFIPAKMKSHISPRLGVSFPLTDKAFFFVNYGQYYQYPLFEYLYSGLNNVSLARGINVLRGNPDLLAERTIAWEISARYNIVSNIVASLAYFKKETYDQVDTKTFVPTNSRIAGDYGFAEYVNNPYAIASGFELVVTRETGDGIRGTFSYSFMKAKGLSDYENQGMNFAQWGFPLAREPFFLSWDQRHTFKADMTLDLPFDVEANVVWVHHTGRPYTHYPSADGFTPDYPGQPLFPNNRRMPYVDRLDVQLNRTVYAPAEGERKFFVPAKVTFYADIRNLFNAQNVRWMDSSGRIGGELHDPAAYYVGRRSSVGMRVEF